MGSSKDAFSYKKKQKKISRKCMSTEILISLKNTNMLISHQQLTSKMLFTWETVTFVFHENV